MRIILLGPPGSGKGTQAQFIRDRYGILQISTGDILRQKAEEQTASGLELKNLMALGNLIPDETIITIVKDRLQQKDCEKGYLLDGFPRTLKQAEALTMNKIVFDLVVELVASDDEIVRRLGGRWVHPGSGRVYHVDHQPPAKPGVDDETGEPLIQRDDDKEEIIRKRLKIYHEQTAPVAGYYLRLAALKGKPQYIKVNAEQPALVVCDEIFSKLG